MPEPILDAIHAARGELAGSIQDEEYRKRLQDKFGNRWRRKVSVFSSKDSGKGEKDSDRSDRSVRAYDERITDSSRSGGRGRRRTKAVLRPEARPGSSGHGTDKEVQVDVPRYRFAPADQFDKPWHLAAWAPNDPDGPTVLINRDANVLEEIVQFHQDRYPDIFAEDVRRIVHTTFGEVAACKVAHSQKLVKEVAEEVLDDQYRSEEALTIGLMGLLAEESLLGPRLSVLGKKREPKEKMNEEAAE